MGFQRPTHTATAPKAGEVVEAHRLVQGQRLAQRGPQAVVSEAVSLACVSKVQSEGGHGRFGQGGGGHRLRVCRLERLAYPSDAVPSAAVALARIHAQDRDRGHLRGQLAVHAVQVVQESSQLLLAGRQVGKLGLDGLQLAGDGRAFVKRPLELRGSPGPGH